MEPSLSGVSDVAMETDTGASPTPADVTVLTGLVSEVMTVAVWATVTRKGAPC